MECLNFGKFSQIGINVQKATPKISYDAPESEIEQVHAFGKKTMRKFIASLAAAAALLSSAVAQPFEFVSQRDPSWSGNYVGTSTSTIGQIGCAITSATMALRVSGLNVNPGDLNRYLTQNGGYYRSNLIIWSVAAGYDGTGGVTWVGTGSLWSAAALKSEIDQGRIVIARSYRFREHWAAITSYTGSGQSWSDFVYADPYDLSYTARRVSDGWVQPGVETRSYHVPRPQPTNWSRTIDNDTSGYDQWALRYPFVVKSGYGLNGSMRATRNNHPTYIDAVARWTSSVPYSGTYKFSAYIPSNYGTTRNAPYEVWVNGSHVRTFRIRQDVYYNVWVELGTLWAPANSVIEVRLIDMTGEPNNTVWIAADGMLFQRVGN